MLWSDSQSTVLGAQKLIAGDQAFLAKNPGNFDLWDTLREITQQLRPLQFQIAWTPSHIDQASCQDSLEEWQAAWNDNADLNAGFINQQRPAELVELLRQDSEFFSYWSNALRLFRRFLLEVADIQQPNRQEVSVFDATPTIDDLDWGEKMHQLTIGEALPGNWKELLFATGSGSKILFAVQLCEQVTQLESGSADFIAISYIELTLLLCQQRGFLIPAAQDTQDPGRLQSLGSFFTRPTLARVICEVRAAFKLIATVTGVDNFLCHGLSRTIAGIAFSCDGVILRLSTVTLHHAFRLASKFTKGRGFRRASDLARPA